MKGSMVKIGALLALFVLIGAGLSFAGTNPVSGTVDVFGTSRIYGGNVAGAREAAISDGLESALELATAGQIPMESIVQHFQFLNDTLFPRTDDYILGYQVLIESKNESYYRVMIRATIAVEKIQEHLSANGIMLGKKPMPRILLIVAEQDINQETSRYWWGEKAVGQVASGLALAQALREKGFTLLAAMDANNPNQFGYTTEAPEFGSPEIRDKVSRLRADVVVVARSTAEHVQNTMGGDVYSYRGSIDARALIPDAGETIAVVSETAVAADSDPARGIESALAQAGQQAGEALAVDIVKAWGKEKGAAQVRIRVRGVDNLSNFVKFRRALMEVAGVMELQTREIRGAQATLVVDYEGSEKDLADALMLKTFDRFGIHISEIIEGEILVDLVPG